MSHTAAHQDKRTDSIIFAGALKAVADLLDAGDDRIWRVVTALSEELGLRLAKSRPILPSWHIATRFRHILKRKWQPIPMRTRISRQHSGQTIEKPRNWRVKRQRNFPKRMPRVANCENSWNLPTQSGQMPF